MALAAFRRAIFIRVLPFCILLDITLPPVFLLSSDSLKNLGRYTDKTAITSHRILEINEKNGYVKFKYKDYRHRGTDAEHTEMSISIDEFIRRFEQHILPFR